MPHLLHQGSASSGSTGNIQVDYELGEFAPEVPIQRGLGVVSHQDESGELSRTVIDVDATE